MLDLSALAVMGASIGSLIAAGGLWKLGAFWRVLKDNRRRLQIWQRIAEHCLEVVEVSSPSARRLKLAAQAGPVKVRIEGARSLEHRIQVVAVVPGPPGFSDVRIRRELRNPLPWVREIEVGDEPFDSTFYLEGSPRLVCALLDAKARDLLLRVNARCRLEIVDGEIQTQTFDSQLSYLLPYLLDLGQRLSQPKDVNLRLASNARRDPVPEVRLQNLILLVRESPENPKTVKVLRRACSDSSPKVRLWSARELGAEGRDVLRQLAASEEDDDCSAQAISALGSELSFEHARAILVQALHRRHIQTARTCLEVLGRNGTATAIDDLAKVMTREKGELAVTAVQALGMAGNTAAEPPLIEALKHETAEVQVAAAKGLGRIGSAVAVLPLQEAAERSPHDQELGRAARQAIVEIQLRLPGASPGQLSLADTEAGRLSLAPTEAGQLSLADDPAGQLSLGDS